MSGALQYRAPGPVSQLFLENTDPLSILWGPVESGKTVTSLMRGLLVTYMQPPEGDGVRREKGAVIRGTYRELWQTTIPSWHAWFPQTMGSWTGGRDEPATHEIRLTHPIDRRPIELVVEFKAFGEHKLEVALRGWEGTWAYVDEVDLLEPRSMPWLYTRLGRYRRAHKTGEPKRMAWGSCNATDTDHWIWQDGIEAPKGRVKVYRLPSGLAPDAEHPPGVSYEKYRTLERVMEPHEARRFVHALPAFSRDGMPVFGEFNDQVHVARNPLEVLAGRQLVIGLDAGGTPAATFWQRSPRGQRRGLAEATAPTGEVMGPRRFGELLGDTIVDRFRGVPATSIIGVADPSAAYGADREDDELDWIETVARVAKIRVVPAPTNNLSPRLEAIRKPLTTWIDGQTPGLILDPSMRGLIRALAADYRYKRVATGPGKWRLEDKPDKFSPNGASHKVDSMQYALLFDGGWAEATAREQARTSGGRTVVAQTDFTP